MNRQQRRSTYSLRTGFLWIRRNLKFFNSLFSKQFHNCLPRKQRQNLSNTPNISTALLRTLEYGEGHCTTGQMSLITQNGISFEKRIRNHDIYRKLLMLGTKILLTEVVLPPWPGFLCSFSFCFSSAILKGFWIYGPIVGILLQNRGKHRLP